MRALRFAPAMLLTVALSAIAGAQEPPPGDPPSEEAQKKAIGQFDIDADGALNEEEIGKAREFLRALRQAMGDRMGERRERGGRRFRADGPPPDGPPGEAPRDRGPGRRRFEGRGPEGRGPEGGPRPDRRFRGRGADEAPPLDEAPPFEPGPRPDGPPGPGPVGPPRPEGPPGPPPRPMQLFGEFDANNDDQLSRDEFEKLIARMRPPRPPGPPRGPEDGPRFGPPGGPPEGGPGPERRDRPRRRGPRPADGDSASAPQRPPLDEPAAASDVAT